MIVLMFFMVLGPRVPQGGPRDAKSEPKDANMEPQAIKKRQKRQLKNFGDMILKAIRLGGKT